MGSDSTELRDWVECLVLPLTDHLTALGNPTWYARFAAQVMADPAYHKTVTRDALALPASSRCSRVSTAACPNCRATSVSNETSWGATC